MPYILISTQIRLETGPTMVGDEHSDPVIMNYLGARKTTMLGNNFSEYHVDEPPRVVLDKLENIGFRLVTMTGVGQTLVWCLHRDTVSQVGPAPARYLKTCPGSCQCPYTHRHPQPPPWCSFPPTMAHSPS